VWRQAGRRWRKIERRLKRQLRRQALETVAEIFDALRQSVEHLWEHCREQQENENEYEYDPALAPKLAIAMRFIGLLQKDKHRREYVRSLLAKAWIDYNGSSLAAWVMYRKEGKIPIKGGGKDDQNLDET